MSADGPAQPRLEASIERLCDGWCIRLPVRREDVHVDTRVVVYEEVDIRRELVEEVEHVDERVRREELDLQPRGDVEGTQPMPITRR